MSERAENSPAGNSAGGFGETWLVNQFGQRIAIGNWIGYGAREGNNSTARIGRVLGVTRKKATWQPRDGSERWDAKVRAVWPGRIGYGAGRDAEYSISTVELNQCFKVDPATLKYDLRAALLFPGTFREAEAWIKAHIKAAKDADKAKSAAWDRWYHRMRSEGLEPDYSSFLADYRQGPTE
jgi:hypothetical protein